VLAEPLQLTEEMCLSGVSECRFFYLAFRTRLVVPFYSLPRFVADLASAMLSTYGMISEYAHRPFYLHTVATELWLLVCPS
jgi:hypothetical protein